MFFKKKPQSNSNQQKQLERLQAIGAEFKVSRTEQNITLESISTRTYIPQKFLVAIEGGDRHSLPEDVYVQAFIRQFGDILGLNGAEISRSFPVILKTPNPINAAFENFNAPAIQLKPIHLYFVYIGLVFLSVNTLSGLIQNNQTLQAQKDKNQDEVVASTNLANLGDNLIKSSVQSVNYQSVAVDLDIKDECWLQVIVDGQVKFDGVLKPGMTQQWVAKDKVTLRAGNAGGIFVSMNGQAPNQLGELGQVREVSYSLN